MFSNLRNYSIGVTGNSGFLGKHLCKKLESLGCTIKHCPHNVYDLTDKNLTKQWFIDCKPKYIPFNQKWGYAQKLFYNNLQMGINLIEMARIYKIKKFIQVGTVCSYPKFTEIPFKEENLWNGFPEETNSGYGIAKRVLLSMLQTYRFQYGLNGIYLMPANLYGPYDNFDLESSHVIPALIKKILKLKDNDILECWGTGSSTRDFLYIEDCVEALILASIYYNETNPVNIGTGIETSIIELINKLFEIKGKRFEIKWNGKLDGQPRRVLDVSKAKDLFGFTATTCLDSGLRKTVEWYLNESL